MAASTFSGNSASTVNGGAIDNGDNGGTGAASVENSTFYGNTASDYGGAISNGSGSTGALTATASTFSGNTASLGGAVVATGEYNGAATVWAAADIFNGSCAQPAGTWNDEGYSVGSDTTCFSATPASTDNASAGAGLGSLLGPLANNGGATETVLPLPGNPALAIVPEATSVNLNGASAILCPTTDQRGVASEPGQACDAGSVQEGLPVALTQSFSTIEGTELTEPAGTLQSGVVDYNPGASSWTAELTATATDGIAVVHPDGSFTYTPDAGFVGTDSFLYTLTDNLGYVSVPATVTFTVSATPVTTTTTLTTTTTTPTSTATTPTSRPARGARPDHHGSAPYDHYGAAQALSPLRPELPRRGHSQLRWPRLRLCRWARLPGVGQRTGDAREGRPRQGNLWPCRHERPHFNGATLWHLGDHQGRKWRRHHLFRRD